MIYHILPVDDTVKHEESISCWCQPTVITKRDWDVVVHNSFDGREDFEDITYKQ
jgi:hypothetical protein